MIKAKIICIGKTKKQYLKDAENDFILRLKGSVDFDWIYINEEKITKSKSKDDIKRVEGRKILKLINKDFFNVLLDVKGKEISSPDFASLLENVRDREGGKICFIIGGPLGVSKEVIQGTDTVVSFSKLTFTHDMIRLLLLEQIYRGFEIIKGSLYHK